MKKYRYILYAAVIALVIGALHPVKHLDAKFWFRHFALYKVVCSVNEYGHGMCAQLHNVGVLNRYYRSKPKVLKILPVMKYEYDLVVHFNGCISLERHFENKRYFENIYPWGDREFLGKILVVDEEDSSVGRYLLGFENGGQAVYEALLKGENVTCRMEWKNRSWVI